MDRGLVLALALALEEDVAVGEEFTLGGAAVLRWGENVPWSAGRYGMEYVSARLPESDLFEFHLSKMQELLGYEPRNDVRSLMETAESIFRGEETGVVPTGIRYGGGLLWDVGCPEDP